MEVKLHSKRAAFGASSVKKAPQAVALYLKFNIIVSIRCSLRVMPFLLFLYSYFGYQNPMLVISVDRLIAFFCE